MPSETLDPWRWTGGRNDFQKLEQALRWKKGCDFNIALTAAMFFVFISLNVHQKVIKY